MPHTATPEQIELRQSQQKEITSLVWACTLATLYHSERSHYYTKWLKIVVVFFWLIVIGLVLNAPEFYWIYKARGYDVIDLLSIVSNIAWVLALGVLPGIYPHSKASHHMLMSAKFKELKCKILNLSAKMPEAYLPLFREELRQLKAATRPCYPLLSLYCNNLILSNIKGGQSHIRPIPTLKKLLRNIYPFKNPYPLFSLQGQEEVPLTL